MRSFKSDFVIISSQNIPKIFKRQVPQSLHIGGSVGAVRLDHQH